MKHLKLAMICLVFTFAVMVVADAEAGKLKKSKKGARTDKTEEQMKPQYFDQYPEMHFLGGTLTRDAHSGWKIDGTPLVLYQDCVITMEGAEEGYLEEGREAVVMGARVGGAISAWAIHIPQPSYKTMNMSGSKELKEAGPNPNVGKILKKAE